MNLVKLNVKIVSFVLMTSIGLSGQELVYPSLRLGVSPTSLANTFQGVQVSLDKSISVQTNVELEAAYIFRSVSYARGFRVRTGIEKLIATSESRGFSVGLLANYRRTVEYRNFARTDPSGEFERVFYNNRRVRQLAGVMASCKIVKKPTTRGTYEVGAGFGPGTYHIFEDIAVQAGDRLEGQRDLFNPNFRSNRVLLAYFHLNFSYILEK